MKIKRIKNRKLWMGLLVIFILIVGSQLALLLWSQGLMLKEDAFKAETILILGAYVHPNQEPSTMLKDRLDKGFELYQRGVALSFLLTGDHGQEGYDEVNAMREYLENKGVPPEVLYLDHAGFSTYDSIVRSKSVFNVKKMVIISQGYHLPRALMIAKFNGVEAMGYSSDLHFYPKMLYYEIREAAARYKDFLKCVIQSPPKYGGPEIPILKGAEATHDQNE